MKPSHFVSGGIGAGALAGILALFGAFNHPKPVPTPPPVTPPPVSSTSLTYAPGLRYPGTLPSGHPYGFWDSHCGRTKLSYKQDGLTIEQTKGGDAGGWPCAYPWFDPYTGKKVQDEQATSLGTAPPEKGACNYIPGSNQEYGGDCVEAADCVKQPDGTYHGTGCKAPGA